MARNKLNEVRVQEAQFIIAYLIHNFRNFSYFNFSLDNFCSVSYVHQNSKVNSSTFALIKFTNILLGNHIKRSLNKMSFLL